MCLNEQLLRTREQLKDTKLMTLPEMKNIWIQMPKLDKTLCDLKKSHTIIFTTKYNGMGHLVTIPLNNY